jgi:opacity protein-like surface antigen
MWRKVLITLGILCSLSSAKAKADDVAYAYCPLGEGYVFLYDTATGFQVLANLKCGEKVTVVDARDNARARVRTADGKEGYVLKSSVIATLPGRQRQPAAPTAPPNASAEQLQPRPQSQPQPESQPKPQSQPQPEPKQSEPQAQAQLQPQPEQGQQPQPEPQLQGEAQPRPEPQPAQPLPEPQPQLEPEPQPAAAAFTPFSTLGYGQNVPRLEVFGGYSFLNAGTSGLASRQNVSGFEGSVAVHANNWLAGEASFSGYYKTLDVLNVGTFSFHDYAVMAGPRVNMRKAFFHLLLGIDHLAGSNNFYAIGASSSDNSLAVAAGGGVQWNISRQLALRTSADYVLSRFEGLAQNNVRVMLGIVYEAGSIRGE